MKKIRIISFLLLVSLLNINAQKRNFSYDLGSSASYITPGHIPFWLRSNQFGSIPLDNASLSLIGTIHKDYDTTKSWILDWGASVEGRPNIGHKSNFTINEDTERISKLMALVLIAFAWVYEEGIYLDALKPIKIKKHGRRDKSLFKYGLNYIANLFFSNDIDNLNQCRKFLS